jgi:hypothetical protein
MKGRKTRGRATLKRNLLNGRDCSDKMKSCIAKVKAKGGGNPYAI